MVLSQSSAGGALPLIRGRGRRRWPASFVGERCGQLAELKKGLLVAWAGVTYGGQRLQSEACPQRLSKVV